MAEKVIRLPKLPEQGLALLGTFLSCELPQVNFDGVVWWLLTVSQFDNLVGIRDRLNAIPLETYNKFTAEDKGYYSMYASAAEEL